MYNIQLASGLQIIELYQAIMAHYVPLIFIYSIHPN